MWSATQIPHILKHAWRRPPGRARSSKLRVIAPDVGGGFGGKLQVMPEEMLCLAASRASSASRSSGPRPARSRCSSAHHGRDQIQDITITAKRDGTVTGLDVRPARRHGRLPRLVGLGHPDPRRVHVQRDLQVPGLPVHLHERVHHQDAHRRLPRRRAAGGHVRHRADHGRARGRARAATRWSCASRTGSPTRSSRSPRCAG